MTKDRLAGAARPAQVDKRDGGVTLVHVRAARLPFAPMCVRLVGRAVRGRPFGSGRVVWPEGARVKFAKL